VETVYDDTACEDPALNVVFFLHFIVSHILGLRRSVTVLQNMEPG